MSPTGSSERVDVRKTHKLYIGGAFTRSESGRTYPVDSGGASANIALASRKDVRDAVVAARKAFKEWSSRTSYNRGQILYRVAEMMETRRHQLTADVARAEANTDPTGFTEPEGSPDTASQQVDAAIDRVVWYAGWTDKVAQVLGNANPVAGPYFNISTPEPTGVVAVAAPPSSSLLGLVSVMLPPLAAGSVTVVVASEHRPIPALTMAEIVHTSDVPAGVVNILTGSAVELLPVLAAHMDVNALDLSGAAPDLGSDLEIAAADSTKRISSGPQDDGWQDRPTLARLAGALEIKTVWHPIGT